MLNIVMRSATASSHSMQEQSMQHLQFILLCAPYVGEKKKKEG